MNISYHHGDLAAALLVEAAAMSTEDGPESVGLRELARRAGVSHAAPAHHFGSRRGLLTALATQGFTELAGAVEAAGEDFVEAGVAYLRFARTHPGHYAVMFAAGLVDDADERLTVARKAAWESLTSRVARLSHPAVQDDPTAAMHAAFSLMHGLASLWRNNVVPVPSDPDAYARRVASQLYPR